MFEVGGSLWAQPRYPHEFYEARFRYTGDRSETLEEKLSRRWSDARYCRKEARGRCHAPSSATPRADRGISTTRAFRELDEPAGGV
jgi:hypothetical protein